MSRFDKSRLPSRHVTEGAEKAPMRAMLLGTGLAPDDLDRPLIGVATTWSETSPCNMPLHGQAKTGVREEGGTPFAARSEGRHDAAGRYRTRRVVGVGRAAARHQLLRTFAATSSVDHAARRLG